MVAAAMGAGGLYLITAPLHPFPGDRHGGAMAIFPGFLLLVLCVLVYAIGKLLLRGHIWGWPSQVLVLAILGLLAALLFA